MHLLLLLASMATAGELGVGELFAAPGDTGSVTVAVMVDSSEAGSVRQLEVEAPPELLLRPSSRLGPSQVPPDGRLSFAVDYQVAPDAAAGEWTFDLRSRGGRNGEFESRFRVTVTPPAEGRTAPVVVPPGRELECHELLQGARQVCGPGPLAWARSEAERRVAFARLAAARLAALEARVEEFDRGERGLAEVHAALLDLAEEYQVLLTSVATQGQLSDEAYGMLQTGLKSDEVLQGFTAKQLLRRRDKARSRVEALEGRHPVLAGKDASFAELLAAERLHAPKLSETRLLARLVRQPRRFPRLQAIMQLGEAQEEKEEAAKALAEASLQEGGVGIQQAAALESLTKLGAVTAAAVPRLAEGLDASRPEGKEAVYKTLLRAGTPEALAAVEKFESEWLARSLRATAGLRGWKGWHSSVRKREAALARTQGEWEVLWKRHRPEAPLPQVEFEREMVLGVFIGPDAVSDLALSGYADVGERVETAYRFTEAPSAPKDLFPFLIVRLPASSKPVLVVELAEPAQGGSPVQTTRLSAPSR